MSLFSQLQQASFDSIAFPIEKQTLQLEQRVHTHEYPKTPGGAPEKLARKNYMITLEAVFIRPCAGYHDELWPEDLSHVRERFEEGLTATLHLPTVGDIQAVTRTLTQTTDFQKFLNGERVTLLFEEDQSTEFLLDGIVNITSASITSTSTAFFLLAKQKTPGLFDQLQGLVNSVIALVDTVQLYGNLLQNKVDALVGLLSFLDLTAAPLNFTTNADLLEAFMGLRQSAQKLQADSQRSSAKLIPFTTPAPMSIGDVSRALYGSSANATKLLKLNALADPLNIPIGTTLIAIAA